MWLGEVFNELGCQAVPALHCRQALSLARRLGLPIRTLVVNPNLPGAARAIKSLGSANPGMRVVLIRDSADRVPGCASVRRTLQRPSPCDPISREEWLAKVREVLA
jgi:hypothetical protein